MARSVTEEVFCDVCGGKEGIERVTISRPGGVTIIELCVNELKILDEWQKKGSDKPSGTPPPKSGKSHKVQPID